MPADKIKNCLTMFKDLEFDFKIGLFYRYKPGSPVVNFRDMGHVDFQLISDIFDKRQSE